MAELKINSNVRVVDRESFWNNYEGVVKNIEDDLITVDLTLKVEDTLNHVYQFFNEDQLELVDEVKESLTEKDQKQRYKYEGPVFYFNKVIDDLWIGVTEAVSEKQALNNLTFKAKIHFGFSKDFKITLDPDCMKIWPKEDFSTDKNEPERPKCPECGNFLNDSGECPLCDLGDESILDENKKTLTEGVEHMKKKLDLEELQKWCDDNDANYWTQDIANNKVVIYGLDGPVAEYDFSTSELETLTKEDIEECEECEKDYICDYVYSEDADGNLIPSWFFVDKIAVAENVNSSEVYDLARELKYKIFSISGNDSSVYYKDIVAAPEITKEDIEEDYSDFLLGKFTVREWPVVN